MTVPEKPVGSLLNGADFWGMADPSKVGTTPFPFPRSSTVSIPANAPVSGGTPYLLHGYASNVVLQAPPMYTSKNAQPNTCEHLLPIARIECHVREQKSGQVSQTGGPSLGRLLLRKPPPSIKPHFETAVPNHPFTPGLGPFPEKRVDTSLCECAGLCATSLNVQTRGFCLSLVTSGRQVS